MTVKTKKIHNDIEALIQKADNILITSHMEPDGDSLGSQLALRRYLIGLEKKRSIFSIRVRYRKNMNFFPTSNM